MLSALLAAALLLGQWLAAGHDGDHGLKPGAGHACAVCVYANSGGAGVLSAPVTLVLATGAEAPAALAAASWFAVARRHHPIRGPPASSV